MSCACQQSPCSCNQSPCAAANVIYRSACTDPGSSTSIAYLGGYTSQFCPTRLVNSAGFLVNRQNASGGWEIQWTESPQLTFGNVTATVGATFGTFIVQGSDGVLRTLTGPATANLYLRTLVTGEVVFGALPAATVPDPLTVVTGNFTNLNTTVLNVTGLPTFSGLASGTITQSIGLNATNQLVIGTIANTGPQTAQFYESASMPNVATPNAGATSGNNLIIGNLIFDSVQPAVPGGALISATNSQTLAVITPGVYVIQWGGMVSWQSTSGKPSLILLINGVPVSNSYTRGGYAGNNTSIATTLAGTRTLRLAAADTIQIQLGAGSGGATTNVYEVTLTAIRTGN